MNERDEATGMVPLHYASAAGKLVGDSIYAVIPTLKVVISRN